MGFTVENCIFFQLAKAGQAGSKFWKRYVDKRNLTAVQAMVLNFLGQEDRITSRELGKRTGLDSATLTGILDRLESAGLIKRQPHPEDRRAIHICLTLAGTATASELFSLAAEANQEFLKFFTPDEASSLKKLLRKIRQVK